MDKASIQIKDPSGGVVRYQHSLGFTAFEMMVTVAILAILAGIAIPSFSNFLKQNQLTGDTNELVGALTQGRSAAIKRNLRVWVDASGGDWAQGWTITTATPQTPATRSTDSADVVRSHGGLGSDNTVTCTGNCSSVAFDAGGFATSGPASFTVMDADGENGRLICLRSTGRTETFRIPGDTTSCN